MAAGDDFGRRAMGELEECEYFCAVRVDGDAYASVRRRPGGIFLYVPMGTCRLTRKEATELGRALKAAASGAWGTTARAPRGRE